MHPSGGVITDLAFTVVTMDTLRLNVRIILCRIVLTCGKEFFD
jgi:hypothetical protein